MGYQEGSATFFRDCLLPSLVLGHRIMKSKDNIYISVQASNTDLRKSRSATDGRSRLHLSEQVPLTFSAERSADLVGPDILCCCSPSPSLWSNIALESSPYLHKALPSHHCQDPPARLRSR